MADELLREMEGYQVHQTKVAYAEDLFERCRELRLEKAGRPDLRGLARWIGLKGLNTLRAELKSPGEPHLDTLRRLAASAGLPLRRSLGSLGVSLAELGEAPAEGEHAALTPLHARLCALCARLDLENATLALRVIEKFLGTQ